MHSYTYTCIRTQLKYNKHTCLLISLDCLGELMPLVLVAHAHLLEMWLLEGEQLLARHHADLLKALCKRTEMVLRQPVHKLCVLKETR